MSNGTQNSESWRHFAQFYYLNYFTQYTRKSRGSTLDRPSSAALGSHEAGHVTGSGGGEQRALDLPRCPHNSNTWGQTPTGFVVSLGEVRVAVSGPFLALVSESFLGIYVRSETAQKRYQLWTPRFYCLQLWPNFGSVSRAFQFKSSRNLFSTIQSLFPKLYFFRPSQSQGKERWFFFHNNHTCITFPYCFYIVYFVDLVIDKLF